MGLRPRWWLGCEPRESGEPRIPVVTFAVFLFQALTLSLLAFTLLLFCKTARLLLLFLPLLFTRDIALAILLIHALQAFLSMLTVFF